MDPRKDLWVEVTHNGCVSWLTESPKDKELLQWEGEHGGQEAGIEPFLGTLSMNQVVSMVGCSSN